MKNIIWKIVMIIWLVWIIISNTFSYKMQIPTPSGQRDIIVNWSTNVNTDRTELVDIINIVNEYLRFILAWLAFVVFVIAGITLITWWSKQNMEKANKMVISSLIAIVASMLSYAIVKLLINLF